jgi:hypothetical protein
MTYSPDVMHRKVVTLIVTGDPVGLRNGKLRHGPPELWWLALMKMYSLDCSELEMSQKCSWRAVLGNNKSIPASSLHSVNVCEDMILIFGGLSDKQTVQTANNTLVFVTPFWTD